MFALLQWSVEAVEHVVVESVYTGFYSNRQTLGGKAATPLFLTLEKPMHTFSIFLKNKEEEKCYVLLIRRCACKLF